MVVVFLGTKGTVPRRTYEVLMTND
jgi:hypothetical protein